MAEPDRFDRMLSHYNVNVVNIRGKVYLVDAYLAQTPVLTQELKKSLSYAVRFELRARSKRRPSNLFLPHRVHPRRQRQRPLIGGAGGDGRYEQASGISSTNGLRVWQSPRAAETHGRGRPLRRLPISRAARASSVGASHARRTYVP